MTKEELNQIFYLNNEVMMWQKELDKLQCRSLIKDQHLSGMPKAEGAGDCVGSIVAEIDNIRTIIEGKLAEIQMQRRKIMDFISAIDDSLIRQIIFYRHISLMKWNEVARNIGGDNTGDGLRMMHDRYLEQSVSKRSSKSTQR